MKRGVSARRACELLRVSRRWLAYDASGGREDPPPARLKELAAAYPRYGYRRLHALLVREGREVNPKRVRRLCVIHGLKLSRRVRRKRRGIGLGVPCKAGHANHVWAYDFLFDLCRDRRRLKILTVEDEFTRECLAIEVERRMNATAVGRVLRGLFAERGVPAYLRSDNGPEFIAQALMKTLAQRGVACRHIEPGSPWQNGLNERFNGTLRDECLNLETFAHRDQARAVCRLFMRSYNHERPHSALGYQTPAEFAAAQTKPGVASLPPAEAVSIPDPVLSY
jgi:putative transposase